MEESVKKKKKLSFKVSNSKLQNRLILFVILLSTIPILTLGAVSLLLIDSSHRQDVSQLELQLIDQKIEEIKKFFVDTLGILEIRVVFTQKSEIELSQQEFILEALLEENSAFEEVSFASLTGIETAKKSRSGEKGTLLDISSLDKFKRTSRSERFVGDVYYTLSGPMVTLAAPVFNRNEEIIQILSAEISLAQLIRSMEGSVLGATGYVVLLDRTGAVIAHGSNADIKPGINIGSMVRVADILDGATYNSLGEKDRYRSFFNGQDVVGAGKKLPVIGWAVLTEWPLSDANALIDDIRNQVVIFTLFSMVAVMLLASFFAGRLISPIKKLEQGATEIERGNFEKQVIIKPGDELEDLGSAFNKMAKGLKRLKELREEFLFVAAHDLKSPVTVIRGYIDMVLKGEAGEISEKTRDHLVQADKANKRLVRLVEDLLKVARSDAGKIYIDISPIDISEPVKYAIEELEPLASKKSIEIVYDASFSASQVLANSDRIKEVMENFVSNAIKYTPKGGVIRVYHEERGEELVTNVEDSGYGIPKKYHDKVFGKFFRAPSKNVREIEGTGLGLFIVKQLIEKMNGKVWFKSKEGKGSTFSFSLPIE
jgi:signal transduction histidine kinase